MDVYPTFDSVWHRTCTLYDNVGAYSAQDRQEPSALASHFHLLEDCRESRHHILRLHGWVHQASYQQLHRRDTFTDLHLHDLYDCFIPANARD